VRKALVSALTSATNAAIEEPLPAREWSVLERAFLRGWSYEALIRAALRRKV